MTKTVLLYESRKNNMGLPLEKLLGEYFTKEEVQNDSYTYFWITLALTIGVLMVAL